ncbi:MAG: hypothetical protein GDA50_07960 [Alphaproteobacteria bacterium GM202ARS2]|nr:hypothetical protein [Alphaproteobacteria bacterium GM202ARS2]
MMEQDWRETASGSIAGNTPRYSFDCHRLLLVAPLSIGLQIIVYGADFKMVILLFSVAVMIELVEMVREPEQEPSRIDGYFGFTPWGYAPLGRLQDWLSRSRCLAFSSLSLVRRISWIHG